MILCYLFLIINTIFIYAINLGLVRLDVVHTPGPGPVDVARALILDLVHVHALVVKVQEDILNLPVVQDLKVKFIV